MQEAIELVGEYCRDGQGWSRNTHGRSSREHLRIAGKRSYRSGQKYIISEISMGRQPGRIGKPPSMYNVHTIYIKEWWYC